MGATTATESVVVRAEELRASIASPLVAFGATSGDAETQAGMLVEGDLRGHHSHGARRLPVLLERLKAGLIVSGVDAEHDWRAAAALHVDGRRGFGPVVGYGAVDAIAERARETGVALAAVRNCGHLGMTAPYVERLAAANCVGMAFTVSEALVHPWGGTRALVGTNPIGIGVPTGGEPIVLDMSTAAISAGKILDYAARDQPIPEGWAVDAHGAPTTDAHAAAEGAISPFGGPKGYALGIALEALVGVLAGTAFGTDVHGTLDVDKPATKGDLFLAISLDALGADAAAGPLTAYLDEVRASGRDGGAVDVPGDRARRLRAERLRDGIPLDAALWARIGELGAAS